MKKLVFRWIQPVTLVVIIAFWSLVPKAVAENSWTIVIVSALISAFVQGLEFINERHVGWRLDKREFFTDVFYVVLSASLIAKATTKLADEPLDAVKHALGITTAWAQHSPWIVQVALTVFLVEFGQYWMHRAMHNTFLWWTHAPHHHITQLNALKGAVGNPIELFLVSLSVVALFDLEKSATFCALGLLTAVSSFAHANVRFDPPRWYSFFWTTIESHSLHHSITYLDTRCNYANSLILIDRMCGTYRDGESAVVGQDERKRLTIKEQFAFPFRPLIAMMKSRQPASTPG